jgi:hypothetical protein
MTGWSGFGSLNLTNVEAENGRSTLKPGSYACKIVGAEVKQTKDKSGHGLLVTFEEERGAGRVEDFINLNNRNTQAVEIGMRRLKGLLIAANHPNPDRPGDVRSLVGLRVGVHVEEGEPWMKDGKQMPGGGKPRKSGAYYKVESGTNNGMSGMNGAPPKDDLDDDIPF